MSVVRSWDVSWQKSKKWWLIEGDANSRYFHRCNQSGWDSSTEFEGVQYSWAWTFKRNERNDLTAFQETLWTEIKCRGKVYRIGIQKIREYCFKRDWTIQRGGVAKHDFIFGFLCSGKWQNMILCHFWKNFIQTARL